ncbi:MAG: AAA family ATPase, partial [Candidatus Woesearchaeota archaeon]
MVTASTRVKKKPQKVAYKNKKALETRKIALQLPSVKSMISHLDSHVQGNAHAKEALAIAFKNIEYRANFPRMQLKKTNLLLFGQTGTGKTYMLDLLTKYCKMPLIKIDMTGRTPAGIWGPDITEDFDVLIDKNNADYRAFMEERFDSGDTDIPLPLLKNAAYAVVYLDEIDKIAKQDESLSARGLQNEVIGLCEQRDILENSLNTRNMLFVGSGAFVGLEDVVKQRLKGESSIGFNQSSETKGVYKENDWYNVVSPIDLVAYGLKPELVGRFPVVTKTDSMTVSALCSILEKRNSPLKKYISLLKKAHDINMSVPKETK